MKDSRPFTDVTNSWSGPSLATGLQRDSLRRDWQEETLTELQLVKDISYM